MRFQSLLLLTFAPLVGAQTIAFQHHAVSPIDTWLNAVTTGPDGAIWTTNPINGQISRITTAGAVTSFQVAKCSPPFSCGLEDITAGPDGAVWFTNWSHGTIGRITTAGAVTEYTVPGYGAPWGITAGPDGALWFCAQYNTDNQIGRITTSGAITMYPIPYPAKPISRPQSITTGPDGALWFSANNYVGRMTTAGAFTIYPVTIADPEIEYLAGITTGPDGALWFGAGQAIGRITTAGAISYFPLSANFPLSVQSITSGPQGVLWFTESAGASLYSMTTSGTVSSYFPSFTTDYGGFGLYVTPGPGGTLWFTDGNTLGEAVFLTATLNVSPNFGFHGTPVTFSGSGYAPGELVNIYSAGIGSPVIAKGVADSSGNVTASGYVPQATFGERLFLGLGQTSGKLGAPLFQMDASLSAAPSSGPPGTSVTVQGWGFWSFEGFNIDFGGTPLGSLTTNIHGSFGRKSAFTFTVPEGTAPGVYSISTDAGPYYAQASVNFTVN